MTVVIDGIEYLSATEVAQQLETTETKVLMLLKQKALSGEHIEGAWYVTVSSLACFDKHACEAAQAQCRISCSSSSCSCH